MVNDDEQLTRPAQKVYVLARKIGALEEKLRRLTFLLITLLVLSSATTIVVALMAARFTWRLHP